MSIKGITVTFSGDIKQDENKLTMSEALQMLGDVTEKLNTIANSDIEMSIDFRGKTLATTSILGEKLVEKFISKVVM